MTRSVQPNTNNRSGTPSAYSPVPRDLNHVRMFRTAPKPRSALTGGFGVLSFLRRLFR